MVAHGVMLMNLRYDRDNCTMASQCMGVCCLCTKNKPDYEEPDDEIGTVICPSTDDRREYDLMYKHFGDSFVYVNTSHPLADIQSTIAIVQILPDKIRMMCHQCICRPGSQTDLTESGSCEFMSNVYEALIGNRGNRNRFFFYNEYVITRPVTIEKLPEMLSAFNSKQSAQSVKFV